MAGNVDFSEVQSALDGPAVILDVRNKDEVESQGHIRGAKNVPLSELENAISLDDDEFKSQYHFDKPSKDDEIITHCMRSGSGRAQKAADTLIAQGYSHVKVYKGSFTDWKAHGGEVIMPDSS